MTVRLRHPELPADQTIQVAEAAVPVHRAAGWVLVEDESPEPPAESPEAAPDTEATEQIAARKRRRTTEGE